MEGKKNRRKWTPEQRQAQADLWTPEMREEARYRALVHHHQDLLMKVMETPERIQMLKKLAPQSLNSNPAPAHLLR
jgi:hypothetical protein